MADRYEIREQPHSEHLREFFDSPVAYVVWDTVRDMPVPFGRYRSRDAAQRRIARMEARKRSADD